MQIIANNTDFELVDLAKNGDEKAFEVLITRYKALVATTAMNMLADEEETKEIGQQVFIQLYRSLPKFRKEAKLGTYITRITINLCLNFLKRKSNFKDRSLELKSTYTYEVIAETNYFEHKELLNKAMQRLDEKQRLVVALRMIQGYDTLETADILKLPKGTVLSRLQRGMQKLKTILEKEFNYNHYE